MMNNVGDKYGLQHENFICISTLLGQLKILRELNRSQYEGKGKAEGRN